MVMVSDSLPSTSLGPQTWHLIGSLFTLLIRAKVQTWQTGMHMWDFQENANYVLFCSVSAQDPIPKCVLLHAGLGISDSPVATILCYDPTSLLQFILFCMTL